MTIPVKYATATTPITLPSGATVRVAKGTHWPADDPIVQARPDVFSDDPRWGLFYTVEPDGYGDPIETATATPGERRQVRRSTN